MRVTVQRAATSEQSRDDIARMHAAHTTAPDPAEFLPPFAVSTPEAGRAVRALLAALGTHLPARASSSCRASTRTRCANPRIASSTSCSRAWPRSGVPLIAARFPRAFLDVNREPYELDPELFAEPLPDFANTQSVRVAGGLGTIARIVADGEEIYRERLPLGRGAGAHRAALHAVPRGACRLIETTRRRFGYAVLIDCHSMPSASMGRPAGRAPTSCWATASAPRATASMTRFLKEALGGLGYEVQINRPYAGGYITEHYGRPGARRACGADRDQPRPVSRRADAAARRPGSRSCSAICRAWRAAAAQRAADSAGAAGRRRVAPATENLISYAICCMLQRTMLAMFARRCRKFKLRACRDFLDAAWQLRMEPRKEKGPFGVTNGPSLGRKRPRRATTDEPGSRCRIAKATGAPHNFQMHFLQSCPVGNAGARGQRSRAFLEATEKRPFVRTNGPSLGRKRPSGLTVVWIDQRHRASRDMSLFARRSNRAAGGAHCR